MSEEAWSNKELDLLPQAYATRRRGEAICSAAIHRGCGASSDWGRRFLRGRRRFCSESRRLGRWIRWWSRRRSWPLTHHSLPNRSINFITMKALPSSKSFFFLENGRSEDGRCVCVWGVSLWDGRGGESFGLRRMSWQKSLSITSETRWRHELDGNPIIFGSNLPRIGQKSMDLRMNAIAHKILVLSGKGGIKCLTFKSSLICSRKGWGNQVLHHKSRWH